MLTNSLAGIPTHHSATNECHTKSRRLTRAKLQPRPRRRYPLNISLENEIDESRFFFGKCRCRLASERRAACNRASARMRPRLHPEAFASAPRDD